VALTVRLHGDLLLASGVSHLPVPLPLHVPAGVHTVTITRTPPASPPISAVPRRVERWLLRIHPAT
jgi:hypothetical protein